MDIHTLINETLLVEKGIFQPITPEDLKQRQAVVLYNQLKSNYKDYKRPTVEWVSAPDTDDDGASPAEAIQQFQIANMPSKVAHMMDWEYNGDLLEDLENVKFLKSMIGSGYTYNFYTATLKTFKLLVFTIKIREICIRTCAYFWKAADESVSEADVFKPASADDVEKRKVKALELIGKTITVTVSIEDTEDIMNIDVETKPGKTKDVYLGIADAIRDYARASGDVQDVTTFR
jgi:hypothetical protein